MQRLLSSATDVPVAGGLSDVDAKELLARVVDLPEDVGTVEIDTWLARRGDASAALLVDALPDASESARVLGFRALHRIGALAVDAVARLRDHPELGAYVTVWRVDALVASADEIDASGDPERFILVLHAVLSLWGPHAVSAWVGGADSRRRGFRRCARHGLASRAARD